MALVVADRVKVRTFTDGTGPFLLEQTFQGHQGFDAVGDGNETYYGIYDVSGNWEIGRGTYNASASTLSRDTIISSSNNNLIVNFSGGGKVVYSTLPSSVANSIITSTTTDSFKNIAVSGQGTLVADSATDTLTIVAGVGVNLTTNPAADTLTIETTGDTKGSVFADDSTLLVDGIAGKIVGDIETSSLRTSEGKIALGFESGLTNQGAGTVAVGQYAGRLNQSGSGVAVGGLAGNTDQGVSAVAVGALAGGTNQGVAAVAVGALAGGGDQGQGTVAIGQLAGGLRQGEYAIAIGTSAGATDQPANSIVLNASGAQLNGSAAGFYVDPIRNIEGGAFLNYNTSTKELGWSNDISSEGDISININLSDSTQRTWRFGEDGVLNVAASSIGGGLGLIYSPADSSLWLSGTNVDKTTDGNGIVLNGGQNDGTGRGGGISLFGGHSVGGTGGSIFIETGIGSGGADNGVISIGTAYAKSIDIGKTGGSVNLRGTVDLSNASITGDIRSESNINIDINLSDSTLRRWSFGEDGDLEAPGNISASTINATRINAPTIDTDDSSAITVIPATIFNSDVTVENELFIGTSRVMAVDEIKSIVAASTDFADFQARIAAL